MFWIDEACALFSNQCDNKVSNSELKLIRLMTLCNWSINSTLRKVKDSDKDFERDFSGQDKVIF